MNIICFDGDRYPVQRRRLLSELDGSLIEKMKELNVAIMGGALTSVFSGERIRDYDLYARGEKQSAELSTFLETIGDRVFYSDNAVTFRHKTRKKVVFQVITLPELWEKVDFEETLRCFDFSVCQAGYVLDREFFLMGERFLEDLAWRRLVYNADGLHPIASLFRVKKYVERGFKISGIDIIKLGLKIQSLKIPDYRTLRREILGVDLVFLKPLTDMLLIEVGEKPYEMSWFIDVLDKFLRHEGLCDEEIIG